MSPLIRIAAILAIVSPALADPATQPASPPIPRETLAQMYQAELGPLYHADIEPKLYEAHQWMERYFVFTSKEDKAAVLKALDATGLDPNILGRVVRIRMNWPTFDNGGVFYINEKVGPHPVMYFLGIPKNYDRTKSWPLLIKLPTVDAFLTNPPPDGQKVAEIYAGWIKEELEAHPDAIVLMPRLNFSELYGPSQAGMNTVIQPMHHVAGRVNIDPARVYMQGYSMSGHAIWNLALHYSTYFAAIAPLSGGCKLDWQRLRTMNLQHISCMCWHDADDKYTPIDEVRFFIRVLKNFKVNVDYEETRLIGHVPSQEIAERVYTKMRKVSRELYPTSVNIQSNRPETMFNRIDWVQIYQPLNPGAEKRIRFRLGSGQMTVYERTHKLQVEKKGPNKFNIIPDNVDAMRLYFNDQLIDMSKPVTITINSRPRFEGMLKPSYDEMLKDQVFLGRGWRYYTAVYDLELGTPIKPATLPTRPSTRPKGKIEVGPF